MHCFCVDQKRSGSESEMVKGVKKAKTDNSNVVDISLDSDDAEPEGKEVCATRNRLRTVPLGSILYF